MPSSRSRRLTRSENYGHEDNLGDGPGELPTADVDLGGPVAFLPMGLGTNHHCVVLFDNTVRCWGNAMFGTLGYGNVNPLGNNIGELPPPPVPVY